MCTASSKKKKKISTHCLESFPFGWSNCSFSRPKNQPQWLTRRRTQDQTGLLPLPSGVQRQNKWTTGAAAWESCLTCWFHFIVRKHRQFMSQQELKRCVADVACCFDIKQKIFFTPFSETRLQGYVKVQELWNCDLSFWPPWSPWQSVISKLW